MDYYPIRLEYTELVVQIPDVWDASAFEAECVARAGERAYICNNFVKGGQYSDTFRSWLAQELVQKVHELVN